MANVGHRINIEYRRGNVHDVTTRTAVQAGQGMPRTAHTQAMPRTAHTRAVPRTHAHTQAMPRQHSTI